ncbi:MAG: hypothetical protein IPL39_02080 [Opitutaceae bacterium]|nr:hypothetical protein [Opitutaceae bacterium]
MTAVTVTATGYQIFQQTRTGVFVPCFQSDSPGIAVEAFLRQSPAFEGGEVRLWNRRQQRLSAAVKWTFDRTVNGFRARQRVNVFYDRRLAELAREIQVREFLREVLRQEMAMTYVN